MKSFYLVLAVLFAILAYMSAVTDDIDIVYIIEEIGTGYYKIGRTSKKWQKECFSNLQTGNPRKLKYYKKYYVTNSVDAEKKAKATLNKIPAIKNYQGGGTEWYYVVGNNINAFTALVEKSIKKYIKPSTIKVAEAEEQRNSMTTYGFDQGSVN